MRVKRSYWDAETGFGLYQTDCLYTDDGQVVAVELWDDENGSFAFFYDYSRGVYGLVDEAFVGPDRELPTPRTTATLEAVEQAYLHSRYQNSYDGELIRRLQTFAHENKHRVPCSR